MLADVCLQPGKSSGSAEPALERCVIESARHFEPAALVLIDLDGFKAVNDTRGHDAGDEVLRDVADALVAVLREGDCGARLGGDEFALVLPRTTEADRQLVAERVRAVIAAIAAIAGDTERSAPALAWPA